MARRTLLKAERHGYFHPEGISRRTKSTLLQRNEPEFLESLVECSTFQATDDEKLRGLDKIFFGFGFRLAL